MWIQTLTGKKVDYLEPDPDQISARDLARGLASAVHFGGHLTQIVTVAQHSILVAEQAMREAQAQEWPEDKVFHQEAFSVACYRWGLLHDAAEAYTGDIPGPLKRLMDTAYGQHNLLRVVDRNLTDVILTAFGETPPSKQVKSLVKHVDNRMIYTEHVRFQGPPPEDWTMPGEPYTEEEVPMPLIGASRIEFEYLQALHKAFGTRVQAPAVSNP